LSIGRRWLSVVVLDERAGGVAANPHASRLEVALTACSRSHAGWAWDAGHPIELAVQRLAGPAIPLKGRGGFALANSRANHRHAG
jgi:hypothetical protein